MGRHLALDHPLGSFAGSPRGWRPFGIFQETERARQPHWHTISLVGCFGVFMDTRQSKFRHVSGGSVCFAGSSTSRSVFVAKLRIEPPLSSPCLPEAVRTGYGAVGSLHAPCLKEARVLSGWACDRFAEQPSAAGVIISK